MQPPPPPAPPGAAGPAPDAAPPAAAPAEPAALDTRELFRHGREVIIVHRNEAYRLKLTRQDKLILTK